MAVYEGILFGIKFKINPIAFTLPIGDGWDIYWYGIMIGLGFLAALIYAFYTAKRYEINVDRMLDVALITTPLAILCARAYYVIFDGQKLESFGDFFGLGNGHGVAGLAIYGGIIGAFLFGGIADNSVGCSDFISAVAGRRRKQENYGKKKRNNDLEVVFHIFLLKLRNRIPFYTIS